MKEKYQLALQFRGDSLDDYDAMIALEEDLRAELKDTATVDGHDMGSGEANIFIFTNDPGATFQQAKPVLERRSCLKAAYAAYRASDGEQYIVIWPEGSTEPFRIG
jgi:hypothetical protein